MFPCFLGYLNNGVRAIVHSEESRWMQMFHFGGHATMSISCSLSLSAFFHGLTLNYYLFTVSTQIFPAA